MAISCEPVDLVAAAECFKCLPDDVGAYLACQWANAVVPVSETFIAGEGAGEFIAGEGAGEEIREE